MGLLNIFEIYQSIQDIEGKFKKKQVVRTYQTHLCMRDVSARDIEAQL